MSPSASAAAARHQAMAPGPVAGAVRWVRGAVVGSVASVVAVGGHVLGAGSAPSVLPLVGLTSAAVLVAVALSGVRWRLIPLLAMLLGAQLVFHLAFGADGHVHGAALASSGHVASSADGVGGRMLALHLLAAAVTAWLLRRGEDACWQLASAVARPVRAARVLATRTVPHRLARAAVDVRATRPLLSRLLVHAAPRRGPPVPAAG